MLTDTTYAEARHRVLCRPIDRVDVGGRRRVITVYELIGNREQVSDALSRDVYDYTQAFEAYQRRDFKAAADGFRAYLDSVRPNDRPAQKLLERALRFASEPPPDDWNGASGPVAKH